MATLLSPAVQAAAEVVQCDDPNVVVLRTSIAVPADQPVTAIRVVIRLVADDA